MKSYLPLFDWNNGDEIMPWDWLWDEDRAPSRNPRVRIVKIRKK